MRDISKHRDFFSGDAFAMQSGVEIMSVASGNAKCSMKVSDFHKNARGVVMGGAIFTLLDFTFAVAANSLGKTTVTQSASITFLKPAACKVLFGEATLISKTNHTCYYEVSATDDKGVLAAKMTVNGYITSEENHLGE